MLVQQSDNKALWINSEWTPGEPGTFAVVIGAGRYDYLEEGSKQASETYELGQLYVQAFTAHRFFLWLRSYYQYPNRPLAMCWLLISPSQKEIDFAAATGDHDFQTIIESAPPPTMDACKTAIWDWFNAMYALPAQTAVGSGAIFFFTGHGLEITQEEQILLPCDYLKPNTGKNDAINVPGLKKGLAALGVREQFLFLDACRNDTEKLRDDFEITGQNILDIRKSHSINPKRTIPTFHGSASGTQAWSPDHPCKGMSLFGQALLDGLTGDPEVKLECPRDFCMVRVQPLSEFMEHRVEKLLLQGNSSEEQLIVLNGPLRGNPAITHLDIAQIPARTPQAPTPLEPGPRDIIDKKFGAPAGWNPNLHTTTINPHDVFGSETMSALWQEATRVYSLSRQQWLEKGSDFLIFNLGRDTGRRTYDIELAVEGVGDHWLELTLHGRRFASLLLDEERDDQRLHYRIRLYRNEAGDIVNFRVRLSSNNPNEIARASRAWALAERNAIEEAMEHIRPLTWESEQISSIASVVANLILLRAGAGENREFLHGLPDMSSSSDAIALRMEFLFRTKAVTDISERQIERFLHLGTIGLPRTSDAIGYALKQATQLMEAAEENILDIRSDQASRLIELHGRLRRSVRYFRSGGLFTVFAGAEKAITPGIERMAVTEAVQAQAVVTTASARR